MDEFTEGLRFKHYGTRVWEEASELKNIEERVPKERYYDHFKFPYFAPGPPDPPLPTPEEIVDAPRPHNRQEDWCNIVRIVHGKYVVKFSTTLTVFQEAENMLFLEQNPVLHVSKLYAAFTHQGADPLKRGYHAQGIQPLPINYIIMGYIEGDTFDKAWPRMTITEREEMCNQIGSYLYKLRSIPQPKESPSKEPYYGRVGYQHVLPTGGMFADPRRPLSGPYNSCEELVEEAANTSEKEATTIFIGGCWEERLAKKLRQFRPALLAAKPEDRRVVFTHHDLKLSNLILRPRQREAAPKESDNETPYGTDYDVVFIDWELSSWMPAFTELWVAPQASRDSLDSGEGDFYVEAIAKSIGPHNMDVPKFLWTCGPLFATRYF